MNNVDDHTIIMMIMMMMNGDRKLTKYTPFIHSFIQSFNGLNSLSILISIIECEWWIDSLRYSTFICILNQLSFIHWLIDWVSEWVVCVILKNTTFHPNIELWNHDWYYYELQLSSIKHIRFDSIIIKLINPCFVTHW